MKKTKKVTIYGKLVRDKIPEVLKNKGIKFVIRKAKRGEYFSALISKLREETEEFALARSGEEMADILEVLGALI